jgi:hypothetical protein
MWWLFGRGSKSIESFKYQYSSRGSALHSLLLALLNQFSFRPLGHPLLDERRGGEHLTENKIESRGISPLADRCQTEKLGTFLRGSTSRRRLVFALPRKDEEEQTRRLAHNRGIGQ